MTATERILLVEPDESDRALAGLVLREQLPEFEVVPVKGFLELVDQLGQGGFAAVIAEHRLGWGDGFRLFEHLRKRAPRALLFLFARRLPAGIATLATVHGLSAYLTKSSAGFLELPRVVRAAMQQGRAARQEEAVAQVIDQLSIGVLTLTREGAVRVANGAAARLLGVASPAEMVGLPLDTWGGGLATSAGWLALLKGQRRLVEHVFTRPGAGGGTVRLGVWQARGAARPGDAYYGVLHRIRAARAGAEPPR